MRSISFIYKAIKILVLLICSNSCVNVCQAQNLDFEDAFFPTPNACDLGKYGIIPVSYYTGTASVSIPLWTMTRGNVDLGITLSYDGSGILMNTLPGWVGQSWSLLAGGVITREIRVKPDEYKEPSHITDLYAVGRYALFGANLPYLGYFQIHNHLNTEDSFWDEERHGCADTRLSDFCADIFHFNFMGLSGSFFLGEDGEWKVDCEQNIDVVFNINDDSNYIRPFIPNYPDCRSYFQPKVIKGFTILDENGTQYIFGSSDVANSADAIEYSLPFSACRWNENYTPWSATSWYLTEIKDRFGNILYELQYERGYFATQCMATDYWVNNRFLALGMNMPSESQMSWPPFCLSITSPVYLTQINRIGLDNEVNNQVCFEWDNAFSTDITAYGGMYSSLGGASAMFNTSYNYGNNTLGCFAPNLVQNTDGECSIFGPYYYLQKNDFSQYQYPITTRRMVNNDTYDPLQATGLKYLKRLIIGDKGETDRETISLLYNSVGPRMHLVEINIKAKNVETPQRYKFTYNNWNNIEREDYTTCNTDHWGYYKRISDPINTIDDFENARSLSSPIDAFGMLSSIRYPTGGCTDFVYQQNSYEKYLSEDFESFVDSQSYAGGYRIHEIITYQDESRNKKLDQKTYDYYGGILTSKPRYSYTYITRYQPVTEYLIRPAIPMKTKWWAHIGYSVVKETNMDGSYIIRQYRNLQPHDLVKVCALPHLIVLPEGVDLASVDGYSQFDAIEDKSYSCGKLTCEQFFDKSQNKVHEFIYEYRQPNQEELIANSSIIKSPNHYTIYSHFYGSTFHDIVLEWNFPFRRYYPKINQTRCIERTKNNNQWEEVASINFYDYKTLNLSTGGYNHKADISKCICSALTTDIDRSDPQYYWPYGVPLDAVPNMENTKATHFEYLDSDYSRSNFFFPLTKDSLCIDNTVASIKEYVYDANGLLNKEIVKPNAMDAKITKEYLSYERGLPTYIRTDGNQYKSILWNPNGNAAATVTGGNVSSSSIRIDTSLPDPREQLRISSNSAFEPAKDLYAVYAQYNDMNKICSMTVGSGQTVFYEYDDFGRLTIVRDLHKKKMVEYSYGGNAENWIKKKTYLDEDSIRSSIFVQYYDGMGRPSMSVSDSYGNNSLYSFIAYDSLGMESQLFLPVPMLTNDYSVLSEEEFKHLSSEYYSDDYAFISKEYDGLGRLTKQTMPGARWQGLSQRYIYDLNNTLGYTYGITDNGGIAQNSSLYHAQINTIFDENNDKRTTVINQLGQKVQDVSYDGTTPFRTCYVYDKKGQLSHVLQPMFQNKTDDIKNFSFRYCYDTYGRISKKLLPGCDSICYWYDKGDRIICMQDGLLRNNNRYRFYIYDRLGRLCIQGVTPVCYKQRQFSYLERTEMGPAFLGTGYAYFGNNTESPASNNCELEVVKYYDDYSFLSKYPALNLLCEDGTVLGLDYKNEYLSNAQYGHTQLTGVWQKASNGEELLATYVYDEYGHLVKHSEIGLGKKAVVKEYSYDFVGNVVSDVFHYYTFSPNDNSLTESHCSVIENKYDDPHTKLITSSVINLYDFENSVSMNDTISNFTYDEFGRVLNNDRSGNHADMSYEYDNLHGWLTGIKSRNGFEQHLFRENSDFNPRWDGTIAAMSWRTDSCYNRTYHYAYDTMKRLVMAEYSSKCGDMSLGRPNQSELWSLIPMYTSEGDDYSVYYEYDKNSNITWLSRYGTSNNGLCREIDQLDYTYNGNQLMSVVDQSVEQCTYNGASDFVDDSSEHTEYEYNGNGALTKDVNRKIVSIEYDLQGNPREVVFGGNKNVNYVYSPDGRKLRSTHIQIKRKLLSYLNDSLLSLYMLHKDSTDYVDNLILKNGSPNLFKFQDGYYSLNTNGSINACHYYIKDYQGNNRMVVSKDGTVKQITHYYPYGGVIGDISTNESLQPYKFEGKELDRTFGLDNYDIEARQYFAMAPMWDRVDPQAEKYYGISPYAYCGGDPVNLVDPDGRHPIYDLNGNFLGTDDRGLQGDYIVMNIKDFEQGMSTEEAIKYRINCVDEETTQTIEAHLKKLPNRPDWDGELTLDEANKWFRNGNGEALFVNAAKVDLSNYLSLGDEYVGKKYAFNILFSSKHGRVFGNLNFTRVPNDGVKISKDTYDFDIKNWSEYPVRNFLTIIGSWIAGDGNSYDIYFYGTNKLQKK